MGNPKSQSVFNDLFAEDHSNMRVCLDSESKSECKTCIDKPELPPQKPCPAPPVPSDIPGDYVQDSDYVHTDNNFTDELKNKLEGIEDGAEVNVQSDWNENNPNSDSYIKNRPRQNIKGSFVSGIQQIEIMFKTSEFGEYPLVRTFNNWSHELIGETSYVSASDSQGNDRKAIVRFYSNGTQINVMENGFYILG